VPKVKKNPAAANTTSANVGYEAQLWQMADALRGSMDAAEYKHVCGGLLFLKYISDGTPPAGNANFAWVQHIVHHLAPAGVAFAA
jgi:type I restriction-modification system DNA methylase subunit